MADAVGSSPRRARARKLVGTVLLLLGVGMISVGAVAGVRGDERPPSPAEGSESRLGQLLAWAPPEDPASHWGAAPIDTAAWPPIVADQPAETPGSAGSPATPTAGADPITPEDEASTAQVAVPVRLRIPAIGVSAEVIPLGLHGDGSLQVPSDFAQTGWWRGGPEPGETGPSVIVGHVDSFRGPAVFFDLGQLRSGHAIHVDRADGTTATFTVRSSMAVTKERFPTEAVYGPTEGPELRLITCHGDFVAGSYDQNLVIFAEPI